MEFFKEVFLSEAGSLSDNITAQEIQNVTHLKISGNINSKDFDILEDMCTSWGTYDEDDNYIMKEKEPPFLKVLDLGKCVMKGQASLGEFTYHSKLEKVILPKNLISTGVKAFEDSIFLNEVILPSTLIEIGSGTFISCKHLKKINLPENLRKIDSFAFSECSSLKSVKIPANVSSIEDSAFQFCDRLEQFQLDKKNNHFKVADGILFSKDGTKLISFPCGHKAKNYFVPNGVKVIADGAFAGSKIERITLPESLVKIEEGSFHGCDHLKELDIPDSVTEIGQLAFRFCTNIEKVKLSNNLKSLNQQLFAGCDKLKELEVPASVKTIKETALGWTGNLERLNLNEGLEEINDDFKFTKIKKLFIPKTVKKIQSGLAIYDQAKFHKFEYEVDKETPYFCTINGSLYNKDKTRVIAVFPTSKKCFVVPDGIQILEDFVFANLSLEQIIFPESLTTIKHRCFENCTQLKEIILPKSLKQLDFRAFDQCKNLERIKIFAENPPILTSPSADCWNFLEDTKELILYVPNASIETYKKTKRWNDIKHIKPMDEFQRP